MREKAVAGGEAGSRRENGEKTALCLTACHRAVYGL